jgi:hypothetical protein
MATPRHLTTLARNLPKRDTWAEKLMWSWLRGRRFSEDKFRREKDFVRRTLWGVLQEWAPKPQTDNCRPMPLPGGTSSSKE